ncbi:MAG: hypothetical protein WDZ59_09415 [Pirellulales bacterium]
MASPFSVFRKYQKAMLVVFGVALMLVFTIGDSLMQLMGGGDTAPQNPVIAEWDSGEIRDLEMSQLLMLRRVLNAFLYEAAQLGAMASGQPPQVELVGGPATEESVLNTVLLAQKAEDVGYVVSDQAINHYLEQLTNNSVTAAQLRGITDNMQLSDRQKVTMRTIFQALRRELLAWNLVRNYIIAADGVPPAARWTQWLRVNDRVVAELVPVRAEDYLDEVSDPTDAQVQEFFEQYNQFEPRPDVAQGTELPSPTPAFRVPRRVELKAVKADIETFIDQIAADISEEQIATYYENNKYLFERASLLEDETPAGDQAAPPLEGAPPAPEQPAAAAPQTEAPPAEESAPAETADSVESAPPAEDAPPESATPEGTVPEDTAPEDTAPEDTAPEGAAPQSPEDASPTEPKADDTSAARPDDWQYVTAFNQPAQEANAPVIDTQAPTSQSPPALSLPDALDTPEPRPQDDLPGAPPTPLQPPTIDAPDGGATSPPSAPPVEYQPLEEVRDEIRRTLARQNAPAEMERALEPVISALNIYYNDLIAWELENVDRAASEAENADSQAPSQEQTPKPEPPDLQALIDHPGLSIEPPVRGSYFEIVSTPLGQANIIDEGTQVAYRAFTDQPPLPLYRPLSAEASDTDLIGNRYVIYKTADEPGYVPKLDELRDQVVRQWKMQKAAELAKQAAEKMADTARTGTVPLAELYPAAEGYEVIQTDPFSWLTMGALSPTRPEITYRLNEIEGVEAAGPDFMQTVFGLDEGEFAVATNHPETVAYVVRLASHVTPIEQLHEDFLLGQRSAYQQERREMRQQVLSSLLNEIHQEEHLEFARSLDSVSR